jgi:hypothetical protein
MFLNLPTKIKIKYYYSIQKTTEGKPDYLIINVSINVIK